MIHELTLILKFTFQWYMKNYDVMIRIYQNLVSIYQVTPLIFIKLKLVMSSFMLDDSIDNFDCQELFGLQKSKSDDSLFGNLLMSNAQNFHENNEKQRSMLLNLEALIDKKSEPKVNVFKKKTKKIKKNTNCDYKKNICGYITKKIIRQFVSETFKDAVEQLCEKYRANYTTAKAYYITRIERVTGPSHIPGLLQADVPEEIPMKKVFRDFFEWFLKERYIRYLLLEGKMDHKQIYIRYKNEALFHILYANAGNQDPSETENSSFNNFHHI